MHIPKPTQENRILKVLLMSSDWVNGRYFNTDMMISQYHARIWSLQKSGFNIKPSEHKDEHGFKSYRILDKEEALALAQKQGRVKIQIPVQQVLL